MKKKSESSNQSSSNKQQVMGNDSGQKQSAQYWEHLSQLGFALAIALVIGVVPGAFIINNNSQSQTAEFYPVEYDSENLQQEQCLSNGGKQWRSFNNTCMDNCSAIEQNIMCSPLESQGCDCGLSYCWDGEECIPNPIPDNVTETPTDSPQNYQPKQS